METERARNKSLPTMDDYISIGYISIGLGPVILTTLYFLGEKLPEQVIASSEYEGLYKHMCIIGRLLNDLMGIKVGLLVIEYLIIIQEGFGISNSVT